MVEKREKVLIQNSESKSLVFLYNNVLGRVLLKIMTRPFISKIAGCFMNSRLSSLFIKDFIKKNDIDVSLYEERQYKSYNDFFTRKLKNNHYQIDLHKNSFIAPCDSKLTAYKINNQSIFNIKGSKYRVEDLLKNQELAKKYQDGYCLIFRLTVDNYHRYCYIDSGYHENNIHIKGILHTVRPIALENYDVYKENSREYTILKTDNFGDVIQIEVGALMIGRIKNNHQNYHFTKGEEKGMFEFGGSTIVLLVEKNKIEIDQEILENTKNGYETIVKIGSQIGKKKNKK